LINYVPGSRNYASEARVSEVPSFTKLEIAEYGELREVHFQHE